MTDTISALRARIASPEALLCGEPGFYITMPRSVVEKALGALVRAEMMHEQPNQSAQDALRAALEQPQVEQEPVAYCVASGASPFQIFRSKSQAESLACDLQRRHDLAGSLAHFHVIPLYTHPQNLRCKSTQARLATLWGYEKPQPPRQPLTEETIYDLWDERFRSWICGESFEVIVKAIERAHGIGGEA